MLVRLCSFVQDTWERLRREFSNLKFCMEATWLFGGLIHDMFRKCGVLQRRLSLTTASYAALRANMVSF